jgi:hypothetical protein
MGQHRWCWFRCLHRRQHNRGRPLTEHVVEPAAELRVTIANKEADPTSSFLQDSHQVTGLLGDPGGVGGSQPSQDYRMADAIQASRSSPPTPAGGRSGSGPNGEWRDGDNSFLKVNVWRAQAEHLADSLSKGDRVMVTGRLRQRPFRSGGGCCIQSGRDALKQRSELWSKAVDEPLA